MTEKWYRVTVEEFHLVEIETLAKNEDEAIEKVEGQDWDENTFIVNDETQDREVTHAEVIEEPEEQKD